MFSFSVWYLIFKALIRRNNHNDMVVVDAVYELILYSNILPHLELIKITVRVR